MRIYARALAALVAISLGACAGGRRCGPCAPSCGPSPRSIPTATPRPDVSYPAPPPEYPHPKPCRVPSEPACAGATPCGHCWPRYLPEGGTWSALNYFEQLEQIAKAAASSPADVCDSECRMRWTALLAETKKQRLHGKVCRAFTCDQLYDRVSKAYAAALKGNPKAAFAALYHKDPTGLD
jgi:hypothetical protein